MAVLVVLQILSDDLRNLVRCRMAVRAFLDFHHGCQRATAEACYLFNGKLSVCISVLALSEPQLPSYFLLDSFGTGDVTGSSATDADDVFAGRLVPEHVIEGSDAGDGRRCDLRQVTDSAQSFFRKKAVVVLNCLQDREDGVPRAAQPLDSGIDELEVEGGFHLPKHHTFVT